MRRVSIRSLGYQIHDDSHKIFRDNATKWWSGREFQALRAMNEIRVPLIVNGIDKPINDSKILDVGCGGGILSESLARLGANVLGIDPVRESISEAFAHSRKDPLLVDNLRYECSKIEDLSCQTEKIESFDAVVASEVLEHVHNVENFLIHCSKVIRPNGSLFITTINQTPISWLGVILFGEYILKQLPKGTHTYDMFISAKGLRVMLERLGFYIRSINGFMYEPLSGRFFWTPALLSHYAVHAVKTVPMNVGINYEQRRNSPTKGKSILKPKVVLDNDEMRMVFDLDEYRDRADEVFEELQNHLDTKLTTQVSVSSLEKLKISLDNSDEQYELREIAQLSLKGSKLIVIDLTTMPEAIKPTMNALIKLGGFVPQVETNSICVPVPRVTREHRESLVKLARKESNNSMDKLRKLFSEFSSRANRKKEGVSDDLKRQAVENLKYDLNLRMLKVDELLQAKIKKLLN